jgi:CheY-like chemotaxis protein
VARALAELGYAVREAKHEEDALRHLEALGGAIDVVLSDVVMPVMGGAELAKRLAERWPSLPVVWMSGSYARCGVRGRGRCGSIRRFCRSGSRRRRSRGS